MDITVIVIIFFIASVIILPIGIYKVYQWYIKELKGHIIQINNNRNKYITSNLHRKISRIRNRIAIGFLAVVFIVLIIFHPIYLIPDQERYIIGGILFGSMMLSIIINNIIVSRLWVCPYCNKRLPVRIGKAGARPKTVDKCPNCKQQLKNIDE